MYTLVVGTMLQLEAIAGYNFERVQVENSTNTLVTATESCPQINCLLTG